MSEHSSFILIWIHVAWRCGSKRTTDWLFIQRCWRFKEIVWDKPNAAHVDQNGILKSSILGPSIQFLFCNYFLFISLVISFNIGQIMLKIVKYCQISKALSERSAENNQKQLPACNQYSRGKTVQVLLSRLWVAATWAKASLHTSHLSSCWGSDIFSICYFGHVSPTAKPQEYCISKHCLTVAPGSALSAIACHLPQLVPFHFINVRALNSRNDRDRSRSSETLSWKPANHTCKANKPVCFTPSLAFQLTGQTLEMLWHVWLTDFRSQRWQCVCFTKN